MRLPYFLERVEWACVNVLYSLAVFLHPEESAKAVSEHTARIQGAFPHENGNGVIFFACDDEFMTNFGFNLILSCYENARSCGVHVHLYEPSAEILQRLEFMKQALGDVNLSYTHEHDIDFGSLPVRGMYYTAFRFVAVGKILEESKSLIVCLDADSLIMSSLHVRPRFYFDQSGLYFSYLFGGLTNRPSFYTVRNTVVDYEFSDTACIWTAKGSRKHSAVFVNASRRIREKYAAALGVS